VSQEDVCKSWVALYPGFTNAYRKIRIPEEGFKHKSLAVYEGSPDQRVDELLPTLLQHLFYLHSFVLHMKQGKKYLFIACQRFVVL